MKNLGFAWARAVWRDVPEIQFIAAVPETCGSAQVEPGAGSASDRSLLQSSSLKHGLYTHFDHPLNTMPQYFQKETLAEI